MEKSAPQTELLLVSVNAELVERVRLALAAWHLPAALLSEPEALTRVEQGHARIVLVDPAVGRMGIERLRAAGALCIVLGVPGDDGLGEVDHATKPAELIAAVFRAQGKLEGVERGGLQRINQFSQAIATQFTLPELVQVAIAKSRELTEAEGASLLLVDLATGELTFDAVDGGAGGAINRVRLQRGHGIAGRVAVEARPRLVADVSTCPDFDASVDKRTGFHTGSIIAVPLVLAGDVLGVLMAVRSTSRRPFTYLHLERLEQLAPHVAIAVHNAQSTTALRASQSEVMQANLSLEQKVRERTEQISRAKQEWERTFDVIDEPIAMMDGFTLRRANQAYARRVRLPIQQIPGKTCHQVLAHRNTPCPHCPLTQGRGAPLRTELDFADARGPRASTYRFSGYWMSDDPTNQSVVVHYADISQARALAERLRESERLAAVGQLASGAAHEINNPLGFLSSNLRSLRGVVDELRAPLRTLEDAGVLGRDKKTDELLELLANMPPPDNQVLEDALEMIDESLDGARRVADIVKGLRELSRLEIGRREPAVVNASVTRSVRAEFGENSPNVVLELEATSAADIPPLQLDQALGHVFKNARQSVNKSQRVVIRTWNAENEVLIQVRDEGMGIARENLRRVFEPFFTTRGIGKGIGLGLTAAYGIVKRAGGDIEAESEGQGKGAVFTIRLPRADAQQVASSLPNVA
jgi:signal transduction histidine kinase/putative methionine-R-sulfoxide reductase with GAF domain